MSTQVKKEAVGAQLNELVDDKKPNIGIRDDIEGEDDEESYYRFVQSYFSAVDVDMNPLVVTTLMS